MTEIFVFGSNLAGRHSKGAALEAYRYHGAIYGQGEGLQGQSYAIPTRENDPFDKSNKPKLRTLHLGEIEFYVRRFIGFAQLAPGLTFKLTPIRCGLSGYKPEQIAPMFAYAPSNIILPEAFKPFVLPAPEPSR